MTGAERIRDAVAADTVLMPGVYDALTARIAARVGFDVVFISAAIPRRSNSRWT